MLMFVILLCVVVGIVVLQVVLAAKAFRRFQRNMVADKLRSEALTEWCEVGQRIRNGEATLDDVERSFFLDDVICRPGSYSIENGQYVRKRK